MTASSFWSEVVAPPPDVVLSLVQAFKEDKASPKVNVSVGAYRDENGDPAPLPVVREAMRRLAMDESQNFEYTPQDGLKSFQAACQKLLFTAESASIREGRVATAQAVGGTGAIRVAFDFLIRGGLVGKEKEAGKGPACVLVPEVSWPVHFRIPAMCGLDPSLLKKYRYCDKLAEELNLIGLLEDLRAAPRGSVVVLHMCAHNPTGLDPTKEQWQTIADCMQEMAHIPLFDNAYQGFVTGDLDEDAYSVRLFQERGMQMLVACSFSKNMGLYGERLGALHVVCASAKEASNVLATLKDIIRCLYSNPPSHGAKVCSLILTDEELCSQWKEQLSLLPGRINKMRHLLRQKLEEKGAPGGWAHLTSQNGMFSYTGLSEDHVNKLRYEHHVYMLSTGRISLSGINESNVDYIAGAIVAVMKDEGGGVTD